MNKIIFILTIGMGCTTPGTTATPPSTSKTTAAATLPKENALSLAEQKIGKPPADFTVYSTGPGRTGSAKIVSLGNLKKKALEIQGGNAATSHYTMYLLNRKTSGDHECSIKFRIQSGTGVRAAGVLFRMQDNRSDYYLLAIKPDEKKLFWTVFKNHKATQGMKDNQILEAKDGWHHLKFSCTANTIRWELNGRKQFMRYNPNTTPDYRNGRFGFWVRSDTKVQFTDMELFLPEAVANKKKHHKLIADLALGNERLISLQLIARAKEGQAPVVMGSLVPEEVGQPGHEITTKALDTGEKFYGIDKTKGISTATIPLRGRKGEIIGAARMRLRNNATIPQNRDLAYALEIAKRIQERLPDRNALLILP
jgi:hypothetical protein